MPPIVRALFAFVASLFRSRVSLQLEIVALRHQLAFYQRSRRRPRGCPSDRVLWSWLARQWARGREVLVFVQPVAPENSCDSARHPGTHIMCQGPPIQSHSGSPMVSQRSPRPGPSLLLILLSQSCFPDGFVRRLAASCCLVCSAR